MERAVEVAANKGTCATRSEGRWMGQFPCGDSRSRTRRQPSISSCPSSFARLYFLGGLAHQDMRLDGGRRVLLCVPGLLVEAVAFAAPPMCVAWQKK